MSPTATHSDRTSTGARGASTALPYRPALLILFAMLIGLYLILRFGSPAGKWPKQSEVHVEITWAAIAAFLLLFSSLSISLAVRAARHDQPNSARRWLFTTLSLGIAFLGFQAFEYRCRWSHNLVPIPIFGNIHDRPDLYYLSAVTQRLMQIATDINTAKVQQSQLEDQLRSLPEGHRGDEPRIRADLQRLQEHEAQRSKRLLTVNRLLNSEARWTGLKVGLSEDTEMQRMAMATLAHNIYPLEAYSLAHDQFRQRELPELEQALDESSRRLATAKASLDAQSELLKPALEGVAEIKVEQKRLLEKLNALPQDPAEADALADAPETSADLLSAGLRSDLTILQRRLDEATAKLTEMATSVTEAEDAASHLSKEIDGFRARHSLIREIDSLKGGLNREYAWLRLPVSLPGGRMWALTYFLMTGIHAVHLLLGVIALIFWLPRQLDSGRVADLHGTRSFWNLVVAIWIILFPLIYLL